MLHNRQAEKHRLAAELDYETNLKAELEIMLLHLNFECGAKCLSCLHISRALTEKPHSEPHMPSMQ
jgi:uncharacterized membrane protein